MNELLSSLFDTADFPARWHCGRWSAAHGWTHVAADVGIFGAYLTIPIFLFVLIRRRKDVPFTGVFCLFMAFILSCGTTHLVEAGLFWWPVYRFSAVMKVITVLVSWATVLALVPVIPKALELPRIVRDNKELRRSNEDLESFAYVASHDLREPLRMVSAYVELLRQRYGDRLDGDAHQFMDQAVDGSRRMSALIDDLLAYAHAGSVKNTPQPVDCEAALQQALEGLGAVVAESGAQVESDGLPSVLADRGQVEQILQNLVSNAIKYRGDAPPRIRVSAAREGAEVVFAVTDNGQGIPADKLDKVFEPFERLHGREIPGTGIGLAICRRTLEAMGGRIWAESQAGAGSTFRFALPAAEEASLVPSSAAE